MGTETVYCLDALTGQTLWTRSYQGRFQGRVRTGDTHEYGGPSATPAFDLETGFLYTLGIDGDLRCWDTNRLGEPAWAINLYESYDVPQRPRTGRQRTDYGYTSTPHIYQDRIIVEVGAIQGTVIAFDKRTGVLRWSSEHKEPAGHSGSCVRLKMNGLDCIGVLTLYSFLVMRTDKGHAGRTVTTTPWQTDFGCNIPTPAVIENRILITTGYNQKRMSLFEVSADGLGEEWTMREYASVSSPVVYRDRVFLLHHALKCIDLATGDVKWRGGGFGHGTCLVTAGDQKLVVFGNQQLALIDPLAGDFRMLSQIDNVFRASAIRMSHWLMG